MPAKSKTTTLILRLDPEKKADWKASAGRAGLSLSAYIRRQVEEGHALERVDELRAEDARRREDQRRRDIEGEQVRPQAQQPRRSSPPNRVRRWPTVGEALQAADRNAGRGGPLL